MCRYLVKTYHCGCETGPTLTSPCPPYESARGHYWRQHPSGDAPGRPEVCPPTIVRIRRRTTTENCPNDCVRPGEVEVRKRLSTIIEESARMAGSDQDVILEEEEPDDDDDNQTIFEEDDDYQPPVSPAQATVGEGSGSECSQDSSECSQDSSSSCCSAESDEIPIALSRSVRRAQAASQSAVDVGLPNPHFPRRSPRVTRPEMVQRRPSPILAAYFHRPEERRSSRRRRPAEGSM